MDTYTFSFRIKGGELDPDQITEKLQLRPRHKRKLGTVVAMSSQQPQTGVEQSNYWTHTPEDLRDDCLIEEVERLVSYLECRGAVLKEITDGGGKCEIFIGLTGRASAGEAFSAPLLARLGALGIGLAIDLHLG